MTYLTVILIMRFMVLHYSHLRRGNDGGVRIRRHFVIIMCFAYFFGLFVRLLALLICVRLGSETNFKTSKGEETKTFMVLMVGLG